MLKRFLKSLIDSLISLECRFTHVESHAKRRILILRKDTLGDYILFYPTLAAYRKKYTDTEITLVISKLFQSLSPLLTDFEHIIWYDAIKYSNDVFYRRRFLLNLKKQGFIIAIQPTVSRETAGDFMIKITDAPTRIGVHGDYTASTIKERLCSDKIYTQLISIPNNITAEIDKNVYVVEKITKEKINLTFPTINADLFNNLESQKILTINELIGKKYIIICPGSGTTFKIWPTEKFASIADYVIENEITPIFCGSVSEKKLIVKIINQMKLKGNAIDISGCTNLPTILHLLKHSYFYFGSDTGITHLAAAIETPTICLMGGGHFGRFFPYGNLNKNKIVYDHNMTCKGDNWLCAEDIKKGDSAPCVRDIRVEDVKKEIDSMIDSLK